MSDENTIYVENPFHLARLKPVRKGKKPPKLLAVVHQSGCTGCEICIQGCPVDSIELVPGPDPLNPVFKQTVEIDISRCIGCQNCSHDCPWETITMYHNEDVFDAWGKENFKSNLYIDENKLADMNKKYGIDLTAPVELEVQSEVETNEQIEVASPAK